MERDRTDWRFTRMDLKRTPSVVSGWTWEREELDRAKACGLIYSASRKLQLPQLTSASACVYLHRFFMRHSLKEFHHYNIAATCLFFACKSEETMRKLDDFIPVIVYYASKGQRKAPPGTGEFEKWRSVILRMEIVVLEALCFDMMVEHPYPVFIELVRELGISPKTSQMAWGFINDCMRLPICLVYSPRSIANAAISLTSRIAGSQEAPSTADDSWLDRVGASKSEVSEIAQWVLAFYTREAQSRIATGPGALAAAATTPAATGSHSGSDPNLDQMSTPASSPVSTADPAVAGAASHFHGAQHSQQSKTALPLQKP